MDDDDDDYVLFGTPLPEIEDEVTLRKKASKELQVRDEKGRQRFHGAFTGGFSAGYFNTVGTKEGWTPSSFISSRNKTADRIQQNPEDFMDDEDFGEFGIATRKIHTTTNFQDTSVTDVHKRKYVDSDSVIPGEAPLKDIVQPMRESIGILILKKLGWRQGQGIGPRIKKYSIGTKTYGCSFPDAVIPEENDPMAVAFTFAPEDTEEVSYKPKDNYFGLGYTGLSKQSVLSASLDPFAPTTTKSWLTKDKRRLKISGQAFGVGAFEDDDEDIYGKDDLSRYDFPDLALKGSEDTKTIEQPKYGSSQGIINGFQLASQPPLLKKHYPPPTLPSNFKPVYLKSVSSFHHNTNQTDISRHALSASDRSVILGERKFQKISLNAPNAVEESQKSNLEQLHIPSSSTASLNFRPFPNDITKQQRYEEYLKLKEKKDVESLMQPSSMTEWEKQQELEEFAKASILFKPLSSALSSRFESRSHLSVEQEVTFALEKIRKEKTEKQVVVKKNLVGTSNRKTFEWCPVSLLCKRMNVPNPYPNSDSVGTQNVCKGKSIFDNLTFSSEKSKICEEKASPSLPTNNISGNKMEDLSKNLPEKQATDTSSTIKNNENLTSEDKKPPMDFFKDIFGSSSEDEAENEKNEIEGEHFEKETLEFKIIEGETKNIATIEKNVDKGSENELNQKKISNTSNIQNSSTNKKVGFGVFANLDLDALNERKPTERSFDSSTSKLKCDTSKNSGSNLKNIDYIEKETESNDMYGPELPPNYSAVDAAITNTYEVSPKKHVKSKSSHKHKHHKHKHKKKKKKKKSSKRNSNSSESSEDELDDIPPSLIIEKIKKLQRRKS